MLKKILRTTYAVLKHNLTFTLSFRCEVLVVESEEGILTLLSHFVTIDLFSACADYALATVASVRLVKVSGRV